MGKVTVQSFTTKNPITLAGMESGICWGADTTNDEKNFKRGLDCLRSDHGRTLEYAQIYLILEEYSARVIREFTRHLGGDPTYLQESTRYVKYQDFSYFTPPSIRQNEKANQIYQDYMKQTALTLQQLEQECGIKREDAANILPLGMSTKIVYRTNLRMLIDMAKVRKCTRAYHEFRELFSDIETALSQYSKEWSYLINEEHIFKRKCEFLNRCNEKNSCGYFKEKVHGTAN